MSTVDIRRVPEGASLADAHAVRRAVFIEEQGVDPDVEMDDADDEAAHIVAYEGDNPIGTARIRFPEPDVAKPERVAMRAAARGRGLGRRLMDRLETIAHERDCERLVLHAQVPVEAFYEACGYERTSDVFEEADIPHVEMAKPLVADRT
jgi:predicted GNAT family N-acyltransferase